MARGKKILNKSQLKIIIDRICHQLIESYNTFEDTCIIGIQEGGVAFAERIQSRLKQLDSSFNFNYGKIDITFYRDDFRTSNNPLQANSTEIDFLIEDQRVILVDDVLFTGRSVHAAISALQNYGRPRSIELVCLVSRRFNRHFPIQPDYTGIHVDSLDEAYVKVEWEQLDGANQIILYNNKITD